ARSGSDLSCSDRPGDRRGRRRARHGQWLRASRASGRIVLFGMPSPFTRKTLAVLRALKRNNDREWFRARKADYEQHVRGPMVELLARLAKDFRTFSPELASHPQARRFRVYRGTA